MDEEECSGFNPCIRRLTIGRTPEHRGMPKEVARLHPWRQLEQWRERWRVHAESQQCAVGYEHEHWLSLFPVRFTLLARIRLPSLGCRRIRTCPLGQASPKKHTGILLSPKRREISGLYLRLVPLFSSAHGGASGSLRNIL